MPEVRVRSHGSVGMRIPPRVKSPGQTGAHPKPSSVGGRDQTNARVQSNPAFEVTWKPRMATNGTHTRSLHWCQRTSQHGHTGPCARVSAFDSVCASAPTGATITACIPHGIRHGNTAQRGQWMRDISMPARIQGDRCQRTIRRHRRRSPPACPTSRLGAMHAGQSVRGIRVMQS